MPLSNLQCLEKAPHYITYSFSGGRFGDQLVSYLHAKWISYKFGIPLLLKEFSYSSQLSLSQLELPFSSDIADLEVIYLPRLDSFAIDTYINEFSKRGPAILEIPYFPLSEFELTSPQNYPSFVVDWNDPNFKKELQKNICLKADLDLVKIPKQKLSVAIHVRLGKEFDGPNMEKYYPLKFPPLTYYFKALNHLCKLLDQRELYVHLFSDDSTTNELMAIFREKFPREKFPIEFGTRVENNSHSKNVLEDFFSLQKFDCIIHSESNFSFVASLIGDYCIKIRPKEFHFQQGQLIIDEMQIDIDHILLEKRLSDLCKSSD